MVFFFFKQKTAYERRISDWSSDVCSSDLLATDQLTWLELFSQDIVEPTGRLEGHLTLAGTRAEPALGGQAQLTDFSTELPALGIALENGNVRLDALADGTARISGSVRSASPDSRSDEHTSELQSLMRISYAVFCLQKKRHKIPN